MSEPITPEELETIERRHRMDEAAPKKGMGWRLAHYDRERLVAAVRAGEAMARIIEQPTMNLADLDAALATWRRCVSERAGQAARNLNLSSDSGA